MRLPLKSLIDWILSSRLTNQMQLLDRVTSQRDVSRGIRLSKKPFAAVSAAHNAPVLVQLTVVLKRFLFVANSLMLYT